MESIHATFQQGVFRPTDPVELPEGCEVHLQIISPEEMDSSQTGTPSATENTSVEEQLANLAAQLAPQEWNSLPSGLSSNLDSYLYETPSE